MPNAQGSQVRLGSHDRSECAAPTRPWLVWAVLAGALAADPAAAAPGDSVVTRVEVGTSTEVSNEQFYESSIDDTTFLGRRLHSSPETRIAAVATAELLRGTSDGRWVVRLVPDLAIGDGIRRIGSSASLQLRPSTAVRLSLEPRADYRDEETFGQVRRDWRASLVGRARVTSPDEVSVARFALGTEILRALSGSDPFLLSGTSARVAIGYDRNPLFGWGWGVEYGATARGYRDSTSRDHLEHRGAFLARRDFGAGHNVQLELEADRRLALGDPVDSRDRFLQTRTRVESTIRVATGWALRPVAGLEALAYDQPDSLTDFDYAVYSASLELRREMGPGWIVSIGPRAERLASAWSPAEEYDELACGLGVERLTGSSWLSFAPSIGHRSYAEELAAASGSALPALPLHSAFDFLELTAFADQRLPGALRLRALATLRGERHEDGDQDSSSLYFSVDLRRLF